MKKNLFITLGKWWEGHRRAVEQPPSRLRQVLRWLTPNGGTLLLVLVLVLAQRAWAWPAPNAGAAGLNAPGPSTTTINYQGRLADAAGNPLTGIYAMSFSLYDTPSAGTRVWGPESHPTVQVSSGLFSVGLGSQTSGGIPTTTWNGDRYLEITVDGETLGPRELLRSVPVAGLALTVPQMRILRQDDTANSLQDRVVQAGWGSIQGDNSPGITETVTFGTAFAEPPIVVVTFLGGTDVPPTSIGDFPGIAVDSQKVWVVVPAAISTAGFEVQISRNVDIFAPTWYYGYSWVAIGTAP
jgi:hypothetical protein